MTDKEAIVMLFSLIEHQGERKYIGRAEVEALRIAIRCIEFRDATKKELNAQYWNDREVRG